MKRRAFMGALAGGLFAAPLVAGAQPAPKSYRIGYLAAGTLPQKEFLEALHDLGYVEGRNLTVEVRGAAGREERLPELAADLVRLRVDVIVAPGEAAAQAAKQATKTIPIVIVAAGDPVGTGLVASLARPDENITGVSMLSRALNGKRLELLKEVSPRVLRVAVLTRAATVTTGAQLQEIKGAARTLGLQMQILEVKDLNDFATAFAAISKGRADALLELPDPLFHANRRRIAEFAAKNKLLSMFHARDFVEAGGLMSYAGSSVDIERRSAVYVGKILKGAKPGDLPVEQPTKFELVINLKTAKALGLTIPPSLLARADEVIQ